MTKGDNTKSKKGRVVILVRDTSSGPVLHFCPVPSKYSKGYSSYRADTKSFSNKTKGDNSKNKKGRVVILVPGIVWSCSTFLPSIIKLSKGYSSYRADKFYPHADADANTNGSVPKTICPHPPHTFGRGGHNTGDRVMFLTFCNSPHGPLSVYQVSLNYLQYFQRYALDKRVTDGWTHKVATICSSFGEHKNTFSYVYSTKRQFNLLGSPWIARDLRFQQTDIKDSNQPAFSWGRVFYSPE